MTSRPPGADCVGFIGLGHMGAPMARLIATAGYRLAVADLCPAAVEHFASMTDCDRPKTGADLGRRCGTVITMLPDGTAVRHALLDGDGVASTLRPGAIVIDMSSASPVGTRVLSAELSARGISLIDAPVSGGVQRAATGKLAIMAGGDPVAIERCRPILELLGQVFVTGGSGSGHAMKALNNYLSAAALVTTTEAMIAGERFGIAPTVMIDVLNASSGRNTATEHKYPAFIMNGTYASGFALGLMAKDLRLALDLVRVTGGPSSVLELCADLYTRAEAACGARADNTEIARYLDSLSERHRCG